MIVTFSGFWQVTVSGSSPLIISVRGYERGVFLLSHVARQQSCCLLSPCIIPYSSGLRLIIAFLYPTAAYGNPTLEWYATEQEAKRMVRLHGTGLGDLEDY